MADIHKGDVGTEFRITVYKYDGSVADLTTASSLTFIFKKRDGSILTKTPFFYTDGTDGILSYYTVDGDLDQVGLWRVQVAIVLPNGSWKTNWQDFRVYDNLS